MHEAHLGKMSVRRPRALNLKNAEEPALMTQNNVIGYNPAATYNPFFDTTSNAKRAAKTRNNRTFKKSSFFGNSRDFWAITQCPNNKTDHATTPSAHNHHHAKGHHSHSKMSKMVKAAAPESIAKTFSQMSVKEPLGRKVKKNAAKAVPTGAYHPHDLCDDCRRMYY